QERSEAGLPYRIIGKCRQEHADAPHAIALLRARHERPGRCRAAEQRNERAPPHSITSLARSRIDVGNTIPNLFAVLRLTTSSNFVGNSAGTSLGFAPRNTLATIGAL